MTKGKQKEIIDFLEEIVSQSKKSNKLKFSLFEGYIVDRAEGLLSNINSQTEIPVEQYEVFKLNGSYIVDNNDPEDKKWEGLKEQSVMKGIGMEMLMNKCYDRREVDTGKKGVKEFRYEIKVLRKK